MSNEQKELEALHNLEKELHQLTSTSMGRRAFISSVPFLMASCASLKKPTDANRYREGDNRGQMAISVAEERRMTNEYLPQMLKEYPLVQNRSMQYYADDLGRKIVASSNLAGKPYNYKVQFVRSKQVNAFALPAGRIFVTTPLLAMADTEAELAGVIGHEIGHVKARHTAERIAQQKRDEKNNLLYAVGGALLGGAAGYGLGKMLCKKEDRECLERAAKYGAMAGGLGGLLIQKFKFMANSQEDEMEADRIGFRTAVAANYHKNYVGRFYSKLLKMEEEHSSGQSSMMASFADAMSTHPPSKKRVQQMNVMAMKNKNKSGRPIVSTRTFEEMKKLGRRYT